MPKRFRLFALALLFPFASAPLAPAATIIWSGANTNTDYGWFDTGNWIGGVAPGSGDDVKFFDPGAAAAVSNINNVVDLDFGGTIASLQYGNTNGFHTTLITNAATLNVTGTGGLTVGTLTDNGNAQIVNATITGAGALNVNNSAAVIYVSQGRAANGNGTQRGILDLSGLNLLTANLSGIGVATTMYGGAANAQNATGTLKLAQTNVITTAFVGTPITATVSTPTNSIQIGADNGNTGGVNFFYLGQSNIFLIDSIGVGCLKTTSTMLFNSGLNNPIAYFRGTGGASSRIRFWTIGDMSSTGSSSSNCNGTNDFSGGTVDALVDTMSLGRDRSGGNTGSNPTRGTLLFTAGTIDVNTLYVGNQFFSTVGNSNPMGGLVNVNGPSATLKVNTLLVLGNTTVNSTAAQKTAGTLLINGGTVLANQIAVGGFSGATNTIAINGGTLVVSNTVASPAKGLTVLAVTNGTLVLNALSATTNICTTNFITSGAITINIASAPIFSAYPATVPLIKYTAIGGDGYGALSLGTVPPNVPGAFLSNDVANSAVDLVVPNDPRPVITNSFAQPVSTPTYPNPGDDVTLTIGISPYSVTPVGYQWYFNAAPLTDGPTGDGSTNSGSATTALTIFSAQTNESGNYTVVITNIYGATTSSVLALIISTNPVAPTITGPGTVPVVQGNVASLATVVAGKPAPALKWQFNGVDLADGPGPSGSSTIAGSGTPTLTISNPQYPGDQGTYSLVATNVAGAATNDITLTVLVPPSISAQPVSLVVTNSQGASFTVAASGVPDPAYRWNKNGVPISSAVNSTATNATLVIASAVPSDIAAYSCTITNLAGRTNSAAATLTVNSVGLTPVAFTPANEATGVCYDTPLYLTFSQPPTLLNVGAIRIYSVTNPASPVDTLDMSLNQNLNPTYAAAVQQRNIGGDTFYSFPVIITGNIAAIYPHLDLLTSNQTYYVTVDNGVFADASGAYFAGISATNVWQFTTRVGGPANPTNLIVAADGSGDFLTVQGAVDSVPSNSVTPTVINVRNGFYREIVDVKARHNLDFRGETRTGAVIGYPNNNNVNQSGAPLRAMFVLNGNDCTFENLTISNTTPKGGSQAEAVDVEGTRATFFNMELDSYQDTFLVHSAGKLIYFQDCLIQGDTDFNWGYGTVFWTNCELRTLTTGGHMTQPRSPSGQNGFSFINCRLTKNSSVVTSADLGRSIGTPGTPAEVIFITCLMDDIYTGYNADAGTNFWTCLNSNLTATVAKTSLANAHELASSDPIVLMASDATNWLYGWQPQVAPSITAPPTNVTVTAGATATLTVGATGIPAPGYQWLQNGTNAPYPSADSATLVIPNAQAGDAATYSVIVSNSAGVVTSSTATLTVITPAAPVISGGAQLLGDGSVQFSFSGTLNADYRVWATTDLALTPVVGAWTQVGGGTFGAGPATFTDLQATNFPQRFYIITSP